MSDIMEATKLSKGSMYVHFENKEVLVNAAVDYNLQGLMDKIYQSLHKHKTNYDKLIAYVDTFKDPNSPRFEGGCPMMNFGTEADDTNPGLKIRISKAVSFSQVFIAEIIENGIKEKEFQPTWDAHEFATTAFAMIEGGIMICRISGNNDKMKIINNHLKKIIQQNLLEK